MSLTLSIQSQSCIQKFASYWNIFSDFDDIWRTASVYTVPYCCQSDVRPPATHTCLIWVVIPGVVHDHWVTLLVEHYLGDTAMLLRTESIAKHQHGSYCQFISDHIGALKISSKSFEMPKTQWSVEFNLLFLIIFQLLFVCLQLKSR